MIKNITLGVFILLAGCASQQGNKTEAEWVNPQGGAATAKEVDAVKKECKYHEAVKEATDAVHTGISAARYEKPYDTKTSNDYSKKAADALSSAVDCIRAKGYSTRDKTTIADKPTHK